MVITVGLCLLLVFAAYFLLGYGFTRRWWKSWEGRALLTSSLAWTLVAAGFLADEFVNVPDWVWAFVVTAAVLGAGFKAWLFFDDSRRPRLLARILRRNLP